jgi:prophage DNA circulation protein
MSDRITTARQPKPIRVAQPHPPSDRPTTGSLEEQLRSATQRGAAAEQEIARLKRVITAADQGRNNLQATIGSLQKQLLDEREKRAVTAGGIDASMQKAIQDKVLEHHIVHDGEDYLTAIAPKCVDSLDDLSRAAARVANITNILPLELTQQHEDTLKAILANIQMRVSLVAMTVRPLQPGECREK